MKNPEKLGQETLPTQEKFFSTEKLRRSARAGTHLPDPTMAPYGYDAKQHYGHLFPKLELPRLFPPASHHPDDHVSFGSPNLEPHQLYLGDNLYVLRQLPTESIDLIYIDPPFFSNRTYTQIWGDDNEVRSFTDIFQDGMFSYLAWLNARLWEMKRVLKSTGSIYVHCDWHASHYIKCEMDKIFDFDNFINEIVWCYGSGGASQDRYSRKHDILLFYGKSANYTFNADEGREPYSSPHKSATPKKVGDKMYVKMNPLGRIPFDWWQIPIITNSAFERIGYPTQKPESLLERILKVSTNVGDVVADFFMGGGSTGAVSLKLGRRFIGCDISRVAVSVTASRLIDIAENISGVTVTTKAQPTLPMKQADIADIRVGYVGSYPQDKFRGISHDEFSKFILTIYQAMPFTGHAQWIHGLANNKIILSIGPGDPNERLTLAQVDGAVKDTVKQYSRQFAEGEDKILQIIGWSFDPQCEGWKRKAAETLNSKGVKLQIDLISLGSESFRQKIFRNVGESNLDLKFNRLNQLLSFTGAPFAGKIVVTSRNKLAVSFALEGARAIGAGARLINCQWDFSYDDKRFASREHALNRDGKNGDFTAILTTEHIFSQSGTYSIAARVQDNLDGQATVAAQIEVSETDCRIIEEKIVNL
ncbi:MAG: site-specific DNA-methyltransferase [Deltaproteobacteria bacterium]|nr:site-specific DNA-methyltransferase [Deltaproteobacteria bacterium]